MFGRLLLFKPVSLLWLLTTCGLPLMKERKKMSELQLTVALALSLFTNLLLITTTWLWYKTAKQIETAFADFVALFMSKSLQEDKFKTNKESTLYGSKELN